MNFSIVRLSNPDVPNDSKVKLAVTVARIRASRNSDLVTWPLLEAKHAAIVPANESPQPVGSTTFSVG